MKHIKKLCQATVKILLVFSLVFEVGVTGAYALEQTVLDEQNQIIENINNNKEKYEKALEILNEAQELDGNDPQALIEHIDYINDQLVANGEVANEDLEALKELISDAQVLNRSYQGLNSDDDKAEYAQNFEDKIADIYKDENTDDEDLDEYYAEISNVLMDIGLAEAIANVSDNSALEIYINGLPMDVEKDEDTVYVGNMVEELEVLVVLNNENSHFDVIKPEKLIVGDNEVKVIITAKNGSVKTYTYNVVRENVFAAQGDGEDPKTSEPVVTPLVAEVEKETKTTTYKVNNNDNEVVTEEETKETKTKDKDEYEEELEEEKGLNGFTVLLIVAGIALIGFGVFMLFGGKDDETPKTNNKVNRPSKQKNNHKNKKRK